MRREAKKNEIGKREGKNREGRRGKIIYWKEKLKEVSVWKRPCIHHMKRRIEFRACTYDYRCGKCEFDQYFNDQYKVYTVVKPVDAIDVKGFKFPQGFYLHRGHTWVKLEEGSMVRIGLDDFAFRAMGPFDRIDMPLVGKEVEQNRADITLRRGI
jgi:hypothetical protein